MPTPWRRVLPLLSAAFLGLASAKQTIWLTGIQPFTSGVWDGGISVVVGAEIMLEQIRAHSTLLQDYDLKIIWQDGQCNAESGTRLFYANLFEKKYYPFVPNASWGIGELAVGDDGAYASLKDLDVDRDGVIEEEDIVQLTGEWDHRQVSPDPIGILGPGCSGTAINIVQIAYFTKFHVVSNTASRPSLSNREEFPNFFRTILPDTSFNSAWVSMAAMLGQRSLVGVIGETENWASMGERLALEAASRGVTLVGQYFSFGFNGIQVSFDSEAMARDAATLLVRYRQRIIVLLMFALRNRLVMCEGYKLGLRNVIFMPFGWLSYGWWAVPTGSCSAELLTGLAAGFISASMMYWRFDSDTKLSCSNSMTAKEFEELWFRRQGASFRDFSMLDTGFSLFHEVAATVDGVCMWAQALDTLLVAQGMSYAELMARTDRAYTTLTDIFQAIDFEGVQGKVTFKAGSADPEGGVLLQQLQVDGDGVDTVVDIATSDTNGGLTFLGSGDLIFGLPGEQVFAGPRGAPNISLDLNDFLTCSGSQTLDMENNTCRDCPPGSVYLDIAQSCICEAGYAFTASTCKECDLGTHAPNDGMVECKGCAAGHFSAELATITCSPCPLGRFSEEEGRSECTSCESEFGDGVTTVAPGAVLRSECRCGGETYQHAESRVCVSCPQGMRCPFGADMAPNASVKPLLLPMYWSDPHQPLSIFRCESEERCPGGVFGSCAPHTEERACAHCNSGRTWDGSQCAECNSFRRSWILFPTLPLLLVPIVICILYKLFGDTYAKWGSWQNGLAGLVFILLNYAQIVALMQSIQLDLPAAVARFFKLTGFAIDMLQAFSPDCSGYGSYRVSQAIGLTAPAVVLVLAFFCWLGSLGVARATGKQELVMERNRTLNVAMSLIYTFFTSIVSTSCTLFKCDPNPNDTFSLVADRSIVCWEADWMDLLAGEIVGISLWCVGVGGLFTHAIFYSSLRHFHRRGVQMRWKFLFIKYRPDVHWWSLVFMARAVVLNMGIIFLQDGATKLYFVMSVLMLYLATLAVYRPWRHKLNNIVDGLTQFCLIAVASLLTRFTVEARDLDQAMSQVSVGVFLLCVFLATVLASSMVWSHMSESGKDTRTETISEIFYSFKRLSGCERERVAEFVRDLGEWDMWHMRTAKNIIMTEFCRVASRGGLSQHNLSKRTGPNSTVVDWDVVDANIGDTVKQRDQDYEGTPRGASLGGTPRGASISGTPRGVSISGSPRAASFGGSPRAASLVGTPHGVSVSGTPRGGALTTPRASSMATPRASSMVTPRGGSMGTPRGGSMGTPRGSSMVTPRGPFETPRGGSISTFETPRGSSISTPRGSMDGARASIPHRTAARASWPPSAVQYIEI